MSTAVKIFTNFNVPKEQGEYYRLLCMTGPNKGKAYFLMGKRVVLGRGDNVDIQILDSKISREHAELKQFDDTYYISDLGSQNGVIVNEDKVTQAKLKDGDKIILGQTVYKYGKVSVKAKTEIPKPPTIPKAPKKAEQNPDKENKSKKIILIVAVLIMVVLFVDTDESEKKKRKEDSYKLKDISDDFTDHIKKKKYERDKELEKKLKVIFQRGLREYREGNYFRSIAEFNHALSLSPDNNLAKFYLDRSKQTLDKQIEKLFMSAKRNIESVKYSKAIIDYCSIIRLLQGYDEDQRYLDAKDNIKEVEILMGLEEGEVKCI